MNSSFHHSRAAFPAAGRVRRLSGAGVEPKADPALSACIHVFYSRLVCRARAHYRRSAASAPSPWPRWSRVFEPGPKASSPPRYKRAREPPDCLVCLSVRINSFQHSPVSGDPRILFSGRAGNQHAVSPRPPFSVFPGITRCTYDAAATLVLKGRAPC